MIKFDMLGIVTRDMAASFRFYALLGWDTSGLDPSEPYQEITLPNGLRFSWNDIEMAKQIEGDWHEPVGFRMGMAFLCDSPSEVDATYAKVLAAGFKGHKEPWDAFWGQRYAQVTDPDGNNVDLFAPLGGG